MNVSGVLCMQHAFGCASRGAATESIIIVLSVWCRKVLQTCKLRVTHDKVLLQKRLH